MYLYSNKNAYFYDYRETYKNPEKVEKVRVVTPPTYAATFDPTQEISDLGPIETEKEWKLIEGILANLTKEDR